MFPMLSSRILIDVFAVSDDSYAPKSQLFGHGNCQYGGAVAVVEHGGAGHSANRGSMTERGCCVNDAVHDEAGRVSYGELKKWCCWCCCCCYRASTAAMG